LIEAALQPKQLALWKALETSNAKFVGFGGALGSAKSHGIRAVNILRREQYRETQSLIFRRTSKELRDNHIDPMLRAWPQLRQFWNVQDKILRLPNGSSTIFGAADDERGMSSFIGPEYDDIFIDQAEQVPEDHIEALAERCRGTGNRDIKRHVVPTCNPGGISHGYLKRMFIGPTSRAAKEPKDYLFIHAFAWDNVEWSMPSLEEDGLTPHDYYHNWNDEQRFEYFITRSDYGRFLNSRPTKRRNASLLGQWDQYDGQYFDIFNPETSPMEAHLLGLKPNSPRWMSGDYGFSHKASFYWHAQITSTIRVTYREFSASGKSPEILAHTLGQLNAGERVARFIIGSDSFNLRAGEESVVTKMTRILSEYGIPEPERADMKPGSRAVRARSAYDALANKTWVISTSCKDLIECLPNLVHDPDDREDVLKVDDDDPYDGATYGLMAEAPEIKKTLAEKVEERSVEIPREDLTSRAMMHLRVQHEEKQRPRYLARMGGARR
jgi:phage terminase large subunit